MRLNLSSTDFSKVIESELQGLLESQTINTVVYDTRKILEAKDAVFFALDGEFRDGHQFITEAYKLGLRTFVISKNLDFSKYPLAQFHKVPSALRALQKLASHHRNKFKYPVIAITGSVGKTTVKEWLYHVLCDDFKIVRSPKSYNSKLGVALSLLEMNEEHELAIIEAGISQANEMHVLQQMIRPDIGVFTAFASAHAHNFANKEEHLNEKELLFKNCDLTFVNSEIPIKNISKVKRVEEQNFHSLLQYLPFSDKSSKQNLSLVLALAQHFGLTEDRLISKIKSLPRLALRMETFDGIHGNLIINDAYNADLDALTQSLEYQQSLANNKLKTAIIGVDGLNENQIQKIKHKLKSYNLYQSFFISGKEIPPIENINNQVILIKGTRNSQIQRIAKLFQLKKHKTRIEINLSAIKQNLSYFRSNLKQECKVLVMVKASSYGSGAEKMAEFLEKNGVHYLGVAYSDEGIELRKHGIKLPILVMNAEEDSFDDIIQYQLEPSIYSFSMLDDFTKTLISSGIEQYPVHLKFDTGMRRLGFEASDVNKVIDLILAQPEIKIQSVYSHLAESDNLNNSSFTANQIQVFNDINKQIENRLPYKYLKHLSNSEGIIRFPEAQYDMVRIGIGLYGITVNPALKKHLQNAISWKTVISQIKTIQAGESVGYSRAFVAKEKTKIAIIPVGYADGFRRSLNQGKGGMFIQNHFAPIVGNVCMDMCMLDITNIHCKEGETVEIIGENQTIEILAKQMETIPYEILTSLSKRLQRVYLEE